MCIVVLAEDEIDEVVVLIDDGQGIELVLPDDVVGFLEGDAEATDLELGEGGHKVLDERILGRGADAVVTAGDDTEQTAVGRAVFGDADRRVTHSGTQSEDITQRSVGANVGVARYEACLELLHAAYHFGLLSDGLRAVDEGEPAIASQLDGQRIVGDRLHDRRDEGDIEADARLFATSEADQRRGQRDVLWGALTCREPWDKEVLPESAGDFVDEYCHKLYG